MTRRPNRLIRLLALVVPRWRRHEWTREWEAELAVASGAQRASLDHTSGAIVDALYLRSHAMYWDLWLGDLRSAWRNAVRRPGFTLLVTLTLALGIGVNSAVFALLDGVLMRPLPYRDPARLVFMWQTLPRLNIAELEATPYNLTAWGGLRTIPEVAMLQYGSFSLTGNDEPERVRGARVTASLLPTLGITPAIGRGFAAAEDFEETSAVAILGDGLWRRRFGSDPAILGRAIQIEGQPYIVVGVMRRGALLPNTAQGESELWLPMRMSVAERTRETSHSYTFIGRLAAGVSIAQASAEFEAVAAQLASTRPSHTNLGGRLVPIPEQTVRGIRPTLVVAAGSVALLLLVAGANASTLLIARTSNRRAELAVRAALGATRARLLSLSIAECVLYASIAGLVGIVLGSWTLTLLLSLFSKSLPLWAPIEVDARAALFSAALSAVIGIVFGVVAAFRPAEHLSESLRGGARSSASNGQARRALVVAQVALAVVLLSAAGLMLSSVSKLARVSPGFAADHLLTFRVALGGTRYETDTVRAAFVADLLGRFAAAPGVVSSAAVSVTPFGGQRNANAIDFEGRPVNPSEPPNVIDQRYASPGYFQTMRIPLLMGRHLAASDDERAERVVIVNRALVRRYFPEGNPLNRRLTMQGGRDAQVWLRIVGVVDDVRHIALSRDPVPEMYHPVTQAPPQTVNIVLRTSGDPSAMVAAARATVISADSTLPIYDVITMEDRIAASFAQARGTMIMLAITALLAATLAAVAIYGSIWYSVVQRTKEIGIRMALGASRATVFRGVLASAAALAAVGIAIGMAAAVASGSLLRSMLFETRTTDPRTYAVIATGVLVVAIGASIAPARRAMSVDPMIALRSE